MIGNQLYALHFLALLIVVVGRVLSWRDIGGFSKFISENQTFYGECNKGLFDIFKKKGEETSAPKIQEKMK